MSLDIYVFTKACKIYTPDRLDNVTHSDLINRYKGAWIAFISLRIKSIGREVLQHETKICVKQYVNKY